MKTLLDVLVENHEMYCLSFRCVLVNKSFIFTSSPVCFDIFRQFEHTPKQSIEQLIISHPANTLLNNRALSVRRLG